MNVISIDQSKISTGVYCRVDKKDYFYRVRTKSGVPNGSAYANIFEQFHLILDKHYFDFAVMEGYITGNSKFNIAPTGAEAGGVIKCVLAQHDITDVIHIVPKGWKKYTIGSISKDNTKEYLRAVQEKYKLFFNNTDEADAYMIYQAIKAIGKAYWNPTKTEKKIREFLERMIDKCKNDV